MSKGQRVKCPAISNETAIIDWIYSDGTVDIKYKGDHFVVTVLINQLIKIQ